MSPAVPAIVVGVRWLIDAPEAGEVIADVGACVSGMPGDEIRLQRSGG